jgi:hypothetical protein
MKISLATTTSPARTAMAPWLAGRSDINANGALYDNPSRRFAVSDLQQVDQAFSESIIIAT